MAHSNGNGQLYIPIQSYSVRMPELVFWIHAPDKHVLLLPRLRQLIDSVLVTNRSDVEDSEKSAHCDEQSRFREMNALAAPM